MLTELALIAATFLGPVFAVQAQKWIERGTAARDRRLDIFKTLMATRAAALSPKHVEALNMIDLEFYGRGFTDVRDAWRTYLDHLDTGPQNNIEAWISKKNDLLAKLLAQMATALKYRFDEVTLKKGAYLPVAHSVADEEQGQLRGALLKVLGGNAPIKIEPVSRPEPAGRQLSGKE